MKNIEIFDHAMCCSTGVCGPSIDTELLRVATVINTLKEKGISIKRYGLSNEPQAFISNKVINGVLDEASDDVSREMMAKQQNAMENMPKALKKLEIFTIPPRSYNVIGIEKIRAFLKRDNYIKLAKKGVNVHLTSTDPANHLKYVIEGSGK